MFVSIYFFKQLVCLSSHLGIIPQISKFFFIKIQIGLTFLVLAYPGCPRKEAVKRMSVCLEMLFCDVNDSHLICV